MKHTTHIIVLCVLTIAVLAGSIDADAQKKRRHNTNQRARVTNTVQTNQPEKLQSVSNPDVEMPEITICLRPETWDLKDPYTEKDLWQTKYNSMYAIGYCKDIENGEQLVTDFLAKNYPDCFAVDTYQEEPFHIVHNDGLYGLFKYNIMLVGDRNKSFTFRPLSVKSFYHAVGNLYTITLNMSKADTERYRKFINDKDWKDALVVIDGEWYGIKQLKINEIDPGPWSGKKGLEQTLILDTRYLTEQSRNQMKKLLGIDHLNPK